MYKGSEWAADVAQYFQRKEGFEKFLQMNEVYEMYTKLMNVYEYYLPDEQRQRARILMADTWRTPKGYKDAFFSVVLMQSYRVFDSSHALYEILLKEIRRSNPEFEAAFVADHERKMERCKVPIWRGSQ